MREIKFRTWDKSRKQMVQVRQILIPDGNNENGLQEVSVSGLKFGTNPSYWQIAPPLMQYTGLKDCKGREIYEGDIIEIELSPERAFTDGQPEIFRIKVVYSEYSTGFHGIRMDDERSTPYSLGFSGSAVIRREVIGNVWENPELLEA